VTIAQSPHPPHPDSIEGRRLAGLEPLQQLEEETPRDGKHLQTLDPHETPWLIIDRANESAVMAGPFETSIEALKAREGLGDWFELDYWVVPERIFADE
jgi:hypothetical protein